MSSPTDAAQAQAQAAFNRALAAKGAREYATALTEFRQAFAAAPLAFNAPKLWAALFNAPDWFERDDEPDEYFAYAEAVMAEVQAVAAADSAAGRALAHAFVSGAQFRHTAHNSQPLNAFMARRAALFQIALGDLAALAGHRFPTPVSAGGKIRYGILLKHLNQDPETTSALPYFEYARSAGIEVILFLTGDAEQPEFGARVRAVVDQVVRLPEKVIDAVQALRAADLDFLFFANDVTAKPSLPAWLTFFRAARCTFTCVATIAPTAAPHMDAYVTANYFGEHGFEREFTERFIGLPFPGFAFSVPVQTQVDASIFRREKLGIPPDAVILASGANHTKLHGRLLRSWATMLRRLPNAYLLLYPFPPHFGPTQAALAKRWLGVIAAAGGDPQRVRMLPSLGSRNAVIALLRGADVGLDSHPYSGLTTIVDAMEAGLPLIAPSGPVLRNNHAAAILASLGLDELIATSPDDYIDRAVALARDAPRRNALRQRIEAAMTAGPGFLDPRAYCTAVVGALRMLYDELKSGGTIRPLPTGVQNGQS